MSDKRLLTNRHYVFVYRRIVVKGEVFVLECVRAGDGLAVSCKVNLGLVTFSKVRNPEMVVQNYGHI